MRMGVVKIKPVTRATRETGMCEIKAGEGTPTELADGFGSHCLTLTRVRPGLLPARIHPYGWFPRVAMETIARFGVRCVIFDHNALPERSSAVVWQPTKHLSSQGL